MRGNKNTVLIIEQNESLGFVVKTVLNHSFQTFTVTTPFDAMDVLSEHDIDCIIIGIDKSSGSLKYFLQHLESSSLFRGVPLIAITDLDEQDFTDIAGNKDIIRVIKKPFDPLRVLEYADDLCGHRLYRELFKKRNT